MVVAITGGLLDGCSHHRGAVGWVQSAPAAFRVAAHKNGLCVLCKGGGGGGGGGFWHVALGVLFSSAAGGAYWPIAIGCPSLGPFPSIGGGAHRLLTAL